MNRKLVYMGLAAAAVALPLTLGAALPAIAQQAMPQMGRPGPDAGRGGPGNALAQFDANKDGAVTQAEIDETRTGRLKQFDKNGDGKLSLEEYQALWLDAYRTEMVRAFQRHDADGDAAVTIEEFNRNFANIVRRADRNGDGKVDAQDQVRPQAQAPQERGQDRQAPGARRPGPQQPPAQQPPQRRGA